MRNAIVALVLVLTFLSTAQAETTYFSKSPEKKVSSSSALKPLKPASTFPSSQYVKPKTIDSSPTAFQLKKSLEPLKFDTQAESVERLVPPLSSHSSGIAQIEMYQDPYQAIFDRYQNFDMDGDGIAEINSITSLDSARYAEESMGNNVVLIIVEPRLLQEWFCNPAGTCFILPDLRPKLRRLRDDIQQQGYSVRLLSMSVYDGNDHQDGRTVLAMREFFRDMDARHQYRTFFRGAILVGSFPESLLVRSVVWEKKNAPLTLNGVNYGRRTHVTSIPEVISERSDIVLSDLNGNWENLYQKEERTLLGLRALPGETLPGFPPCTKPRGACKVLDYEISYPSFRDYFFIPDGDYSLRAQQGPGRNEFHLFFSQNIDREIGAEEQNNLFLVANPDINISRINALHVAVDPDPSYLDPWGNTLLDAHGNPQPSFMPVGAQDDSRLLSWRNPILERQLINEYLDRNHEYRQGQNINRRVATIGFDFKTYAWAYDLRDALEVEQHPLAKNTASLLDLVQWLKQPAFFRGILAHSNPTGSEFWDHYDVAELSNELGGNELAYYWDDPDGSAGPQPGQYLQGFNQQGGVADLRLYKTIWQNGLLAGQGGSFYLHGGCQTNSPANATRLHYKSYSSNGFNSTYGRFQNAEGILFYLNGLAIMSRAKVFWDYPGHHRSPLHEPEYYNEFGNIYQFYFIHHHPPIGEPDVYRKRPYFWSMLGDWTLRLHQGQN